MYDNFEKQQKIKSETVSVGDARKIVDKFIAIGLTTAVILGAAKKNVDAHVVDENTITVNNLFTNEANISDSDLTAAIKKAQKELQVQQQKNELQKQFREGNITVEQVISKSIVPSEHMSGLLQLNREAIPEFISDNLDTYDLWVTMKYYKNGELIDTQRTELADEMFFKKGNIRFDKSVYTVIKKADLTSLGAESTNDEVDTKNEREVETKELSIAQLHDQIKHILLEHYNIDSDKITIETIDSSDEDTIFYAKFKEIGASEDEVEKALYVFLGEYGIINADIQTLDRGGASKTIYNGADISDLLEAIEESLGGKKADQEKESERIKKMYGNYSVNIKELLSNQFGLSFQGKRGYVPLHVTSSAGHYKGKEHFYAGDENRAFSIIVDYFGSNANDIIINFSVVDENNNSKIQSIFTNSNTYQTEIISFLIRSGMIDS